MSESAECRSVKCRMARGEIPPGPFTPSEFAALGLVEPTVASSNPEKEFVSADPEVVAALASVEVARVKVDQVRREWEAACTAVAEAQLATEAQLRSYNPNDGNRPGGPYVIPVPGSKTELEDQRDEARERFEVAGRAFARANDRLRAAQHRARARFLEADQPQLFRRRPSSEPVRRSLAARAV
ncbi:hypothetical protein [Micromonospora aurantiaca (nom. illeg.)]|uniref:hypothetical protein n=1 Tax=Micromonospora aurantiaca (nom. illeg.) TaxID=47850 RepID=UPI00340E9154